MVKDKILKMNKYFLFLFIILFSLSSIFIILSVSDQFYQTESLAIQKNYTSSQKELIKNQVYQFIAFIDKVRKNEKHKILTRMKLEMSAIGDILNKIDPKYYKIIVKDISKKVPILYMSITKTTKPQKFKNNFIYKKKTKDGIKYCMYRLIHHKYLLTIYAYNQAIEKISKKIIINRANNFKYGIKGDGYIIITKILKFKGGNNFAKILALRIKPQMVGKMISDTKKDARGEFYRKKYMKMLNKYGEGYESYYFFKDKSNNKQYHKITFFKIYKPYNWLVATGVYVDDIESIVNGKKIKVEHSLIQILKYYFILLSIFLVVAYFFTKYGNKNIEKIIKKYEKEIKEKNEKLKTINDNLENEVKRKTEELIERLFIDNLTGFPNREKFITDSKNKYIAILNIDSFREINDFYGVKIGDKILIEVGEFLSKYAIVYKLQADEYGIIGMRASSLKHIIDKIFENLKNKKFIVNNEEIIINMKAGIATRLSNADLALKYAKLKKNKPVIVYNKNLPLLKEFANNLKWKKIIVKAIEEDNILPFVQPIVNNKTNKIDKYECLVRLKDDDKIYTPFFFLDIAKKTSLYTEIQKIMVEKSFKVFQKLDCKFSINLSMEDFTNYTFMSFFFNKIREHNVENKLIVELLEDEMINFEEISAQLQKLKEFNVQLAMDDFGSGYSNFIYLEKMNIDIVKIDGSIIKNIDDPRIYAILSKMTELLKELNLEVVGEFIENKEILSKITELGIDYSQGYYFGQPFDIRKL